MFRMLTFAGCILIALGFAAASYAHLSVRLGEPDYSESLKNSGRLYGLAAVITSLAALVLLLS